MWILLIIFSATTAQCFEFHSSTFSIADQCINLCKTRKQSRTKLICQRGCRFFNILKFKDELHLNATSNECYISCEESCKNKYDDKICKSGCDLMARKQVNEMTSLVLLTQNKNSGNIVLAQPDLEILETDVLSDPSIKSQLEIGFNIDYKIPETNIRTMPITVTETVEEIKVKSTGDWLDCAARNSGIPRWILLSVILVAVLIALRLSFTVEKKDSLEETHTHTNAANGWRLFLPVMFEEVKEEESALVSKDPLVVLDLDKNSLHNAEKPFQSLAPPKYSVESEQV